MAAIPAAHGGVVLEGSVLDRLMLLLADIAQNDPLFGFLADAKTS